MHKRKKGPAKGARYQPSRKWITREIRVNNAAALWFGPVNRLATLRPLLGAHA